MTLVRCKGGARGKAIVPVSPGGDSGLGEGERPVRHVEPDVQIVRQELVEGFTRLARERLTLAPASR